MLSLDSVSAFTNSLQAGNITEAANGYPQIDMRKARNLLIAILFLGTGAFAQSRDFQPNPAAGPGTVIVHSKFGGQIFGFDIDQSGTEGLLSEDLDLSGGDVLAAVETFSQSTGEIMDVVSKTENADNYLTMGVVGH